MKVGVITQLTQPEAIDMVKVRPHVYRVIKAKDRTDTSAYITRHELSMLSLLVRRYPQKASEFLEKCRLTHAAEKA